MEHDQNLGTADPSLIRDMLIGSGYSEKAVDYYLTKSNMGSIPEADQVTAMTGTCGDTMKVFLKIDHGRIEDAKIQVLGCPGAVSSAMAALDLIKGKTIEEARKLTEGDIFRTLESLPVQKHHCISLSVRTVQKALEDYLGHNGGAPKEDH